MGGNTVETKAWLDKYLNFAPGKSTIVDQFAKLKPGHTSIDDVQHSGHPKKVIMPENIRKPTKSFQKTIK